VWIPLTLKPSNLTRFGGISKTSQLLPKGVRCPMETSGKSEIRNIEYGRWLKSIKNTKKRAWIRVARVLAIFGFRVGGQ